MRIFQVPEMLSDTPKLKINLEIMCFVHVESFR